MTAHKSLVNTKKKSAIIWEKQKTKNCYAFYILEQLTLIHINIYNQTNQHSQFSNVHAAADGLHMMI